MISVSLAVVPLRTSDRIGSPAAAMAAVALTPSFGFAPASGTAASTNSVVPVATSLALAMVPPQKSRVSRAMCWRAPLVRRDLASPSAREDLSLTVRFGRAGERAEDRDAGEDRADAGGGPRRRPRHVRFRGERHERCARDAGRHDGEDPEETG